LQRLRFLEPVFSFKKSFLGDLFEDFPRLLFALNILFLEEKIASSPEFWKFRILIRDVFVFGKRFEVLDS